MMLSFTNPFLSVAGQLERLSNAGETILAAVTGKGVTSNTGIKPLDVVLSTAASNPFATAAVVAVAINPTVAVAAVKEAGVKVASMFEKASVATKAKVVLGSALIAPVVIAKPVSVVKAIAKTPSAIMNVETNIVKFVQKPSVSSAATIIKENPIIAGVAAAAGVALAGVGLGTAGSIAATFMNTQAEKANTQAMIAATQSPGNVVNPENIINQSGVPTLATQSKEPVPEASLTSTPLKASGATGISGVKKGGKTTKHRHRKGKVFKCGSESKRENGNCRKCYKFY